MNLYTVTPLAVDVSFAADRLLVELDDGRLIGVPIEWFPRLRDATDDERRQWELIGDGEGIHWPAIDEDLSVRGFLSLDAGPIDFRPVAKLDEKLEDSDHPAPQPSTDPAATRLLRLDFLPGESVRLPAQEIRVRMASHPGCLRPLRLPAGTYKRSAIDDLIEFVPDAQSLDRCLYRCDRCGHTIRAVASSRLPDVLSPLAARLAFWNDVHRVMPEHQEKCGGTIRREEFSGR